MSEQRIHTLKIVPPYFVDVCAGVKTFEIRNNDRDFLEGDVLDLREYLPDQDAFTGRSIMKRVAYVYRGSAGGLAPGHVALALRNVGRGAAPEAENEELRLALEEIRLAYARVAGHRGTAYDRLSAAVDMHMIAHKALGGRI